MAQHSTELFKFKSRFQKTQLSLNFIKCATISHGSDVTYELFSSLDFLCVVGVSICGMRSHVCGISKYFLSSFPVEKKKVSKLYSLLFNTPEFLYQGSI